MKKWTVSPRTARLDDALDGLCRRKVGGNQAEEEAVRAYLRHGACVRHPSLDSLPSISGYPLARYSAAPPPQRANFLIGSPPWFRSSEALKSAMRSGQFCDWLLAETSSFPFLNVADSKMLKLA